MNEELLSALIRISPFIILMLVIYIFIRLKRFNSSDIYLQKPNSWSRFAVCYFSFLLFILITEITLYRFGLLEVTHWHHTFIPSVIRITGAVILAPVAEELFFRGLILYRLEKLKMNRHAAILLQAGLFVLAHNFAYENTMQSNIGVVQSFADATLYAYAKYQTKSLFTPIAMHMTGNLIATLEQFIL
ncbi:MAG: CPBP family intramembrane glutamic endopeptidase [Chitinophagales bacterium]